MNTEKLTTAMENKISEAVSLAVANKNAEVTPLHLLWAISCDSQSCLNQILRRKNIATQAIANSLQNHCNKLAQTDNTSVANVRASTQLANALHTAIGAAQMAGDEFLSVDMYLISEQDASVREYLGEFIAPNELSSELRALRGNRQINDREQSESANNLLDEFTIDITALARAGKLDPIIGREEEINRCLSILLRKSKNNPILLGEPGVGKTAIVEALAQAIADKKVPKSYASKRILSLKMSDLVAGTKYRGEFEKRMSKLIEEVKNRPEVIIFIDEIHTLLGTGGADGSAADAAQMLKPALSRGEFCTIGATTLKEYKKYFEKDPALQRRFAPVMVNEPSVNEAIAMMRGLCERLCAHHQVSITDSALVAAVKLSDKYIKNRFLPDKAIDLIDEACAELKMQIESQPAALRTLASKIAHLQTEKEALKMESAEKNATRLAAIETELADALELERQLMAQLANEREVFGQISKILARIDEAQTQANLAKNEANYTRAGELEYGQIPQLKKDLQAAKERWEQMKEAGTILKNEVDEEAIALILERATGISASTLIASEREKLAALEDNLAKQVIAQDDAIKAVAKAIKIAKAGLNEENKPIGSFLFAGSTGVGKTELAKALARELFGDERQVIRFDMNEYGEEYRVSQLLGSSRGYVGSEQGGDLTEAVRNKPYSILLFDEIEKAHPKIFNIFLNMLDEGAMRDNAGNFVSFRNCVIIFTSNAGAQLVHEAIAAGKDARAVLLDALKHYFKPEFLNRLSEIVCFNDLDSAAAGQIAKMQLEALALRMSQLGFSLEFSDAAISAIAEAGFSKEFGARAIKRAISQMVQAPLSDAIIARRLQKTARIDANTDGSLQISCE